MSERVCARIDLGALEENIMNMRRGLSDQTKMIGVIKTDGYGHGAVPIARKTEPYDFMWGYAVATVEEAMELRDAGICKPILLLGYTFPESYDTIVRNDLRPAVFKYEMARQLDEAAERAGITAPVHLALDTGMSRIGVSADEKGADEALRIASLPHLFAEGLFSHFARADEADKTSAYAQYDRYRRFLSLLEERGVQIPMKHIANSAAIAEMSDVQMDAVRAGITLYGIYPSDEMDREKLPLKPVMSLISHIAYIKEVPCGTPVSYGGTYVTSRPTRIATIPVGYGDGYPRLLSGKGSVLIRGRRAPILGRVCMDQFMVDVTDIEAEEYDRVTLLGSDGGETVSVDEIGHLSGRFPYELVCDINKRVPRVYVDG